MNLIDCPAPTKAGIARDGMVTPFSYTRTWRADFAAGSVGIPKKPSAENIARYDR